MNQKRKRSSTPLESKKGRTKRGALDKAFLHSLTFEELSQALPSVLIDCIIQYIPPQPTAPQRTFAIKKEHAQSVFLAHSRIVVVVTLDSIFTYTLDCEDVDEILLTDTVLDNRVRHVCFNDAGLFLDDYQENSEAENSDADDVDDVDMKHTPKIIFYFPIQTSGKIGHWTPFGPHVPKGYSISIYAATQSHFITDNSGAEGGSLRVYRLSDALARNRNCVAIQVIAVPFCIRTLTASKDEFIAYRKSDEKANHCQGMLTVWTLDTQGETYTQTAELTTPVLPLCLMMSGFIYLTDGQNLWCGDRHGNWDRVCSGFCDKTGETAGCLSQTRGKIGFFREDCSTLWIF